MPRIPAKPRSYSTTIKFLIPFKPANNEKEANRIKKAIGISEQTIEKLEKEIATIDEQLKDSAKYQTLAADPNFFTKYQGLKDKLGAEMKNWEELSSAVV